MVYGHRDLEEARRDIAGLAQLGLRGRVLDLACGAGRHLRAMREVGIDAMGMDLSPQLLARARELAPNLRLLRANSRRPPFRPASFDVALSLFTSFGYHDERSEDAAQLAGIAPLLVSGGLLFLDLAHPERLRSELVPTSSRQAGELQVEETRSLEADGRRVVKELRVWGPGRAEPRAYREAVNLYEPAELDTLLEASGFTVEARWGDLQGRPFVSGRSGSLRQVVRARCLL